MKNKYYPGNWILGIFLVTVLLLDGMDLFDRGNAPDELGHFTCSMLPFSKIGALLVPHQLAIFVNSYQCAIPAQEPQTSIILFTLKIFVTLFFVITAFVFVLFNSPTSQDSFDQIDKNGGIWGDIKESWPALLGLALASWYVLLKFDKPPIKFSANMAAKYFEDFTCVILLLAALCILSAVYKYISYTIVHIRNKR